jgi:hypothetical protein
MAKLTAADRKAIPKGSFAVPSKAPGSGSYPIPDASHARNALARASGKPVQGQVDAAVHRKFPGIGKDGPPPPAAKPQGNGPPSQSTARAAGPSFGAMPRPGVPDTKARPAASKPGGGNAPMAAMAGSKHNGNGAGHMTDWADKEHPC